MGCRYDYAHSYLVFYHGLVESCELEKEKLRCSGNQQEQKIQALQGQLSRRDNPNASKMLANALDV